ncbi:hypothetical protein [Streptomyces sp. NPDC055709]
MSEERFWRRSRVRRTAGWTAAAVAVAGGLFYLTGGYDAWQRTRALDSVCEGDLAVPQVRALFPGVDLESNAPERDDRQVCRVRAWDDEESDAALVVVIKDASARHASLTIDAQAAPLGYGWTGSFAFSPDVREDDRREAWVNLLVDCGKGSGGGFLVEAEAEIDGPGFTDPRARERLVAVATETAARYAKRNDCAAVLGKPVTSVGVTTTKWDHKRLADADGTCADVLPAATAERWGIRTVVESRADRSPLEACTFGGLRGVPLYSLFAAYGPHAKEARSRFFGESYGLDGERDAPDGAYQAYAECPGAQGEAFYTITARDGVNLDHKGLRTALKTFAQRSSSRHGCGALS